MLSKVRFGTLLAVVAVLQTGCSMVASLVAEEPASLVTGAGLQFVIAKDASFAFGPEADQVRFHITASEPVDGSTFTVSDFDFGGTSQGPIARLTEVSPTEFDLDVAVSATAGTVTAELRAGTVKALSGAENEVAVSAGGSTAGAVTSARISEGEGFTCYVDAVKMIRCFGYQYGGQLGDGVDEDGEFAVGRPISTVNVTGPATFKKVSALGYGACALDGDGKIYCWGDNYSNEAGAGVGADYELLEPTPTDVSGMTGDSRFIDVAADDEGTCAVTADARLFCWGQAAPATTDVPLEIDLAPLGPGVKVSAVDVGWQFACALTTEGRVFCWGRNFYGQLGDGTTTDRSTAGWIDESSLPAGTRFREIRLNYSHACALTFDGDLYCWGGNADSQLGDGTTVDRSAPTPVDRSAVPAGEKFWRLATGADFTCAISSTGKPYCFGYNWDRRTGNGSADNPTKPVPVDLSGLPAGTALRSTAISYYRVCGETTADGVLCWGWAHNDYGTLFRETPYEKPVEIPRTSLPAGQSWSKLTSQSSSMCALSTDGTAYCWGNGGAKMGVSSGPVWTPTAVDVSAMSGATKFSDIHSGKFVTCGVATDGKGYCWGMGGYVLGQGSGITAAERPAAISTVNMTGATTFSGIRVAETHACGVATDGKGYCWGGADIFSALATPQLGNGTGLSRNTPYPIDASVIPGAKTFTKIIVSQYHSCGLMTDGAVYCWGSRWWTGGASSSQMDSRPRALDTSLMGAVTTFSDIEGTMNTFCGRSTDGKAYCWGGNSAGSVGDGTTTSPNFTVTPVLTSGVTGPLAVSLVAGFNWMSCGVLNAVDLHCWGDDVPSPSSSIQPAPVKVDLDGISAADIVSLVGTVNVYALTGSGRIYCWGFDCSMGAPRDKATPQLYENF